MSTAPDARRLKLLWKHARDRWTHQTTHLMVEDRLLDDPPGPLMPLGEQDAPNLPDYVIFKLRTVRDRFGTPLCLEVVCDDVVVETVALLPGG